MADSVSVPTPSELKRLQRQRKNISQITEGSTNNVSNSQEENNSPSNKVDSPKRKVTAKKALNPFSVASKGKSQSLATDDNNENVDINSSKSMNSKAETTPVLLNLKNETPSNVAVVNAPKPVVLLKSTATAFTTAVEEKVSANSTHNEIIENKLEITNSEAKSTKLLKFLGNTATANKSAASSRTKLKLRKEAIVSNLEELNANLSSVNSRFVAELPIDLNLKSMVEIRSEQPFNWLKERVAPNSPAECHNYFNFISKYSLADSKIFEGNYDVNNNVNMKNCEKFGSLLNFWQYPTRPFTAGQSTRMSRLIQQTAGIPSSQPNPSSTTSFSSVDSEELALYKTYSKDWRIAFRSAYNMLRNGFCQDFYFIQGKTTVLFSRKSNINCSGAKNNGIVAVMNQSNYSLRKRLEDEGIDFEMPNQSDEIIDDPLKPVPLSDPSKGKKEDSDSDQYENEQENDEHYASDELAYATIHQTIDIHNTPTLRIDGTVKSTLLFPNLSSVHNLFDYLINQKDTAFSFELPVIVSLCPFELASLQCNKVIINKSFKRLRTESKSNSSSSSSLIKSMSTEKTETFILSVEGLIFPTILRDMCEILKSNHSSFNIKCKSKTNTSLKDKTSNLDYFEWHDDVRNGRRGLYKTR